MKKAALYATAVFIMALAMACEFEHTLPVPPPEPRIINIPDDQETLQDAIEHIKMGDDPDTGWVVTLADGEFVGEGFWDIDLGGLRDLVIQSENGPDSTVIKLRSGSQTNRAFDLKREEDSTTIIRGITFKSGRPPGEEHDGGVVRLDNSSPKFVDCVFTENNADQGAVIFAKSCQAIFDSCQFISNSADETGGAIETGNSGNLILRDCMFEGNNADWRGGAIATQSSTIRVTSCNFRNNASRGSPGYGGVVYADQSSPRFEDCVFTANFANQGGVLYSVQTSSSPVIPTFNNCSLVMNSADAGSAVLSSSRTRLIMNHCVLALGLGGYPVELVGSSEDPEFECCNMYGHEGGRDWEGDPSIVAQADANNNMEADPMFCNPAAGDVRVKSESPCLPENNSCGVQIGALVDLCE